MLRIFRMGMVFLKNSKMLTFSAFLSIFFACFLSISMFQLSTSAEISYKNSILEEYGDYQIGISKEGGEAFTLEEAEFIKKSKGVTRASTGYYEADLEGIYVVGVEDDEVNQSRYKYTYPVKEKNIVINSYLSEKCKKKTGERISLLGQEYTVKEILTGDSFTQNKMFMIIMDMAELHGLLGNADTEQSNYFLLQCADNVNADTIVERLEKYNENFQVYSVESEETVQKLFIIFKGLLMVLFVIVVVISGMFILSIFHEYMRKYRKDMAVIRTVGGKRKQISLIFLSMSLTISFFGCTVGAVACVLFDDVLLNKINQKINFFSGSVIINWSVLIQMAVTVFVLFNVFVMVFFWIGQNVLPIQVFQETSTGLRRNKKGNRFLGMRKLVGTEGYLGIKLLIPKFWQNAMIIFIIALITALSYTGQGSIKILNENNFSYYRDLMHGFDAYGEIQSEKTLEPDRIMKITEQIQEFSTQCCTLLGQFDEYGRMVNGNGKDLYGFYVTDLTGFMSQFKGMRMENWEVVPKEQRMIMTEKTAEYIGYQLGDTVTLDADWLGGKKKFTIVEIVEWNNWIQEEEGIILDHKNLIYTEAKAERMESPYSAYFFVNGEKKEIEELFVQLEEKEKDSKWLIFEDIIEESNDISMQRLTMIKMVMIVLILVAGIGWLNSAKGMLVARKQEYQVLRMLGATEAKVRRISWIQVWSYMLSGILIGVGMGILIVYLLWRTNVNENVSISIYWENIVGIALFLFALSLFLKPTIKKLAG